MRVLTQLDESEIEETFSHSSGPGGQNVNKVATKVTLRHTPTGISVSVQDSRLQSRNREIARERLLAAINDRVRSQATAARQAREKKRRRNRPRPLRVKKRIRESKTRRSDLKKQRGKIRPSDC